MELRKSATVLEKKSSGSSLDIAFRRGRIISVIGVLNIPNLHIRDYSSFIFHNLIAFEMQSQSRGRCTMAFSAFMRNLLQSEEDVKLLRRRGILANTSMTDGELVDFFKRLSRLIENYQMPSDLRWFKCVIGVFHIPLLHILDYSSLIFYNLIVFEMQSSTRGRCTMAVSALMRNLLQSEEDVKLLRQRGILVSSSMTDRQLIDLFARLSRLTENHQMPYDLSSICHQVQSHHKNLVSRLCGGIILQCFSKPVVTLSVLVAALLFVPTLLQTIYAMIYHS
ncbi:hypothetical protein ACMD2_26882 [Ananas comosus]|uniref:Uncharacterized protein n=1 Tax=Ananas comosus TaxID=4615 RepID=A0A199V0Z9_ANACO|nr:hypothetical protein ACMD2_26882 [Ananas comosus]